MVDLLVLNYNDAKTTIELLKKVKNYKCIRHIVVVDNKSTDDSYEVIAKEGLDKVTIISSPKNGGYGYGNNYGIKYLINHYNPEYILLVNPDIMVDDNTIDKLESYLKMNPEYVMVAPVMCNADGERQFNSGWNIPTIWEYIFSMSLLLSRAIKPGSCSDIQTTGKEIYDVDAISGSLVMFKADMMFKYGMYDENIFLYCEETVLAFKFRAKGLKSCILTKETYIHNHSVSITKNIRSHTKRRRALIKSRLYVLKKYYKANGVQYLVASFFGYISYIEINIINIRNLIQKRQLKSKNKNREGTT